MLWRKYSLDPVPCSDLENQLWFFHHRTSYSSQCGIRSSVLLPKQQGKCGHRNEFWKELLKKKES